MHSSAYCIKRVDVITGQLGYIYPTSQVVAYFRGKYSVTPYLSEAELFRHERHAELRVFEICRSGTNFDYSLEIIKLRLTVADKSKGPQARPKHSICRPKDNKDEHTDT